jgi:hypothetical protein
MASLTTCLALQETSCQELQESQEQLLGARVEADRNALKLQQAGLGAPGKPGKENALPADSALPGGAGEAPQQDMGFIQKYLARIAQLEKEIRRLKEVQP